MESSWCNRDLFSCGKAPFGASSPILAQGPFTCAEMNNLRRKQNYFVFKSTLRTLHFHDYCYFFVTWVTLNRVAWTMVLLIKRSIFKFREIGQVSAFCACLPCRLVVPHWEMRKERSVI